MFDISAWRRPWIAVGLVAWMAAMLVHAGALLDVDYPTPVGWVLFLSIFPLFFAAIFTHPRAIVRGAHAHIDWIESLRGAWPPYVVLGLGSFFYGIWIWDRLGVESHLRMEHHLAPPQMAALSALTATFFALSVMLQSSARSCEQLGADPGP